MSRQPSAVTSVAHPAALLLAGMALWLASHPYEGIWHDARVYSIMALHWLDAAPFARDPWFMFGSQSDLSLFPAAYGSVVGWLGVEAGACWVAALGGMFYVFSVFVFSRCLPLGEGVALAFLFLVSLFLPYCPGAPGILQISESFATARPFAIGLSLMALAADLSGHLRLSLLAHAGAIALHPLMGVWPLLLSLCARMDDRKLLALTLTGCAVAGLALGFEWPALQSMSPRWVDLVRETSVVVFMPHLQRHDGEPFVLALSLLLLGSAYGHARLQRWYVMAALLGASGWLLTVLCSLFYPAALVMQIQPWRALWLAMVLAVVAACDLTLAAWQMRGRSFRAWQVGIVAVSMFGLGGGYALLAWYAILRWPRAWAGRLAAFDTPVVRHGGQAVFAVALVLCAIRFYLDIDLVGHGKLVEGGSSALADFVRGSLLTAGYGMLPLLAWLAWRRLPPAAAVLLAVIAVVGAASAWDQRTATLRSWEYRYDTAPGRSPFAAYIRSGDTVYWQNQSVRVWYELKTASYAGSTQAIGIVFSEKQAEELRRRLARVALAGQSESALRSVTNREVLLTKIVSSHGGESRIGNLRVYEDGILSRAGLRFICEDDELDWVIHRTIFPDLTVAVMTEQTVNGKDAFGLYDCRHIRLAK